METPQQAPNCTKCTWFNVSWDSFFPRACSLFRIKSVDLPSQEVYRSTGTHCPAFEKSPRIKE